DSAYEYSCAVLSTGAVKCWGLNDYGQLGDGSTDDSETPVEVSGIDGSSAVATGIGLGDYHACALLDDGSVKCWGYNDTGQLGDGTTDDSETPVDVSSIDGSTYTATAIAIGGEFSCALLDTGAVKCWGNNSSGQLGDGSTDDSETPVDVGGIDGSTYTATSISAGYEYACALLSDGSLKCWGDNNYGQLGDGSTDTSETPVDVTGIDGSTAVATAVTAAEYHTCTLLSTGAVKCWGDNSYGQLGDGSTDESHTPVDVSGIDGSTYTAIRVTAGGNSACAVLEDGSTYCWGNNDYGQLGDGSVSESSTAMDVEGIDGSSASASEIDAGAKLTCSVLSSGSAACWGRNNYGQLGDGSTDNSSEYVTVSGIDGITATATEVTTGGYHACALLDDGAVKCWGRNGYGQLGDTSTDDSEIPVDVSGIDGSTSVATQIAAGSYSTCALLSNGAVKCWGFNSKGQLGNGSTTDASSPSAVSGIDGSTYTATAISVGHLDHACALLDDGSIMCWGENKYGQLGNASTTDSSVPVDVSGIDGSTDTAIAVDTGYQSSCAILDDGSLKCWGRNNYSQLGDGTTTTATSPTDVSGIDGSTATATKLAVGDYHSCAILDDGSVNCWGRNDYGQLGDGTTTTATSPTEVSGIDGSTATATAIASGDKHTCAILDSGAVNCWGNNSSGQLGDGSISFSSTAIEVVSLTD
ncbi:MAG: RCC1 repeat-containing protein, partial [Chloroflexi bacterium]|nr:RCC1 repeat-containing protein [Chloroflexota bacterium]